MFSFDRAEESAKYILSRIKVLPQVAVILGSGLSSYYEKIKEPVEIPYDEIPNFPPATAIGHQSRLVFGKLKGKYVIAMCGRFHFYEGYSMEQCAFPVHVFKVMGVKTLIITNAAGCINSDFEPGDMMLIKDHIKMVSDSPLRGANDERFGPRFNDMSAVYTPALRDIAKEVAYGLGITLREGVYAFMPGPSYETPAEIRALGTLGADAVGMSTVGEVIAAAHCGLEILGISLLSNMASGITNKPLTAEEVLEAGRKSKGYFSKLMGLIIEKIPN